MIVKAGYPDGDYTMVKVWVGDVADVYSYVGVLVIKHRDVAALLDVFRLGGADVSDDYEETRREVIAGALP